MIFTFMLQHFTVYSKALESSDWYEWLSSNDILKNISGQRKANRIAKLYDVKSSKMLNKDYNDIFKSLAIKPQVGYTMKRYSVICCCEK